jgi:hypothetical protein
VHVGNDALIDMPAAFQKIKELDPKVWLKCRDGIKISLAISCAA